MKYSWEKKTRWEKVTGWFSDHFILLIIVGMIVLIGLGIYASAHRKTISVPVEACQTRYTGRTQVVQTPIQQCAGYDRNGQCTAPFTTWVDSTQHEVRYDCAFTEWR